MPLHHNKTPTKTQQFSGLFFKKSNGFKRELKKVCNFEESGVGLISRETVKIKEKQ